MAILWPSPRVHRLSALVHGAEEAAVLCGLGRVVRQHLGVAGHVAARQHDTLLRVDAHDVAVFVGRVHAHHLVAFLDELLALQVETRLGAGLLRGLQRAVHGPAVIGQQVHHAGEARVVLLAPIVVLVHREALREHVGLLGVGGHVVVAGQQLVLGSADVPVQVRAGVRDPIVQQLRIGAVAHDLHQLVDHFLRLRLLDAQLLVDLAAERAELARAVAHVGTFIEAERLRARLRGFAQRAHARQAEAHHAHIDVDGFGYLRLVDGRRRVHERRHELGGVAARRCAARTCRAALGRACVCARIAFRSRRASREAGRPGHRSCRAQAEKRATGEFLLSHNDPLPSSFDEMDDRRKAANHASSIRSGRQTGITQSRQDPVFCHPKRPK